MWLLSCAAFVLAHVYCNFACTLISRAQNTHLLMPSVHAGFQFQSKAPSLERSCSQRGGACDFSRVESGSMQQLAITFYSKP